MSSLYVSRQHCQPDPGILCGTMGNFWLLSTWLRSPGDTGEMYPGSHSVQPYHLANLLWCCGPMSGLSEWKIWQQSTPFRNFISTRVGGERTKKHLYLCLPPYFCCIPCFPPVLQWFKVVSFPSLPPAWSGLSSFFLLRGGNNKRVGCRGRAAT